MVEIHRTAPHACPSSNKNDVNCFHLGSRAVQSTFLETWDQESNKSERLVLEKSLYLQNRPSTAERFLLEEHMGVEDFLVAPGFRILGS